MFDKFGDIGTDNLNITTLPHWSFGDSPKWRTNL